MGGGVCVLLRLATLAALLLGALLAAPIAAAAAPQVFHTRYYESPVQGGPDDLLFLGGLGFQEDDRVVYEAMHDHAAGSAHPDVVPERSTRELGVATIVKVGDPPYSLTIRLPQEVSADQAYNIWVVNAANEWSERFSINDPRPLWISPAYVYTTVDFAGLGRRVRVIGRNLRHAGANLNIRLEGPRTYTLAADEGSSAKPALREYIAEATLPPQVAPGSYTVSISEGGDDWIEVPGQKLAVLTDPPRQPRFNIGDPRFGSCRANDGADDSSCFAAAIEAARQAGGGVVAVPAGTWDLYPLSPSNAHWESEFTLTNNIHIRGAGAGKTTLVRHDAPQTPPRSALLLLEGNNWVTGLQFTDERHFDSFERARAAIQLGHNWNDPRVRDTQVPRSVRRVVISADRFRRVGMAIENRGLPVEQLFVTHNDLGGYARDLEMPGSRWGLNNPYRIDDAVIRWNRFVPGSYVDVKAGQGVIATGMGASRRVDFSSNDADGASTEALQNQADPRGWRAAFFWNMSDNIEGLLIADNRISCPGDKAGDGEAIAFDPSANVEAYHGAQPVTGASADSVSVQAEPVSQQAGRDVDPASYYVGLWVQIVEGPGIGQTRKIRAYQWDPLTSSMVYHLSQAWDVPPTRQSRIAISGQYWQAYLVANEIIQSAPTCHKSNLNRPRGGQIALAGQTIDSIVDRNQQHDTDGIAVSHGYQVRTPSCPQCEDLALFQTALEIRGNVIDGEYDWSSDCSDSGVRALFGASPTPEAPPPITGFGVQFSHNVISHADALRGGAINIVPTWYVGPGPQHWRLIENLILAHNIIRDVDGPPPTAGCKRGQRNRPGIRIEGPDNVHDAVLYKNTCEQVSIPLQDAGAATARICPAQGAGSCECATATR